MNNKIQNKKRKSSCSGFIALISTILLSALLLTLTLSVSQASFSARTNALHAELKRQSLALAESCMHQALLFMTQNYSYSTPPNGNTVSLDTTNSLDCTISKVSYATENTTTHTKAATVWTTGNYRGAWSVVKSQVTVVNPLFIGAGVTPISIQSWTEATSTQ